MKCDFCFKMWLFKYLCSKFSNTLSCKIWKWHHSSYVNLRGVTYLLVILGAAQPQVPEEMGATANLRVRRSAWSHWALCSHPKGTVKQVRLPCFPPYERLQAECLPLSLYSSTMAHLCLFFVEWDFVLFYGVQACGGQRTTLFRQPPPSTFPWVLGIKLRSPGLQWARAFTPQVILPIPEMRLYLNIKGFYYPDRIKSHLFKGMLECLIYIVFL